MKIASKAVEKTFRLISDENEEAPANVTIGQATYGDSVEVAEMTAKQTRSFKEGEGWKLDQDFNFLRERALKIYLTLRNAENIQNEDGTDYFRFKEVGGVMRPEGANREAFYQKLFKLDDVVVGEIYEYVLDMNPQWDPAPSNRGE